jgi:mono/diheme cytochrome c family protein
MKRKTLAVVGSVILGASLAASMAFGQNKAAEKGDAAKGKEVFEQCQVCHNVDTDERKMGPSLKGLFKKKQLTNGKPANDANVLNQINNGGNGMPAYGDMLTAQQKADLLAYLHTV